MTQNFVRAFNGIVFATGEVLLFEFHGQTLKATVKGVQVLELPGQRGDATYYGLVMEKTDVNFLKAPDSAIKLKSSARKAPPNAILAPNFKFEDMGIGGLDQEFSAIFRRAFASRVFPPALVEKLGIAHVKGILLYGPPGTGKTLMARQIGKMLNAREPKIVNGPEILNKYVGASEENIRKLFADAEKEASVHRLHPRVATTDRQNSTRRRATRVVCTLSSSTSWMPFASSVAPRAEELVWATVSSTSFSLR